jgi:antitoxin MazE
MKTRIQKWGNSLAVRIPKSFAIEARLDHDAMVDIALVEGKLIITPVIAPPFSLDQLLADITAENLHHEHATGQAVGDEVW